MDELMISVSGVRGIIGKTLTPELVTRFAMAFGTYLHGGTILVGRDTRVSGAMVKHSVFAGLISTGCQIIDLGIATTPSCSLSIIDLGADGGIVISGSHNPVEWNALKLFRSDGICLNVEQGKEFLDIYYQGSFRHALWHSLKADTADHNAGQRHMKKVLANTDVGLISKRAPKVVLDSCNGAGAVITTKLLRQMGCEVVEVHCEPNGLFPHNPEPIFVNLGDLCAKVKEVGADIGFAQDADADRMAIVDENGDFLGEEYSLALATLQILEHHKGPVVANLSTSRMVDDVAERFGCEVVRTPVGEANVAERMKKIGAVIGGEGNGGVIYPEVHYGRDSFSGMALVLQLLASRGKKISEIAAEIPSYSMRKVKIDCTRDVALDLVRRIEHDYSDSDARLNTEDGVRIDTEDAWIHVRPSGTEPAVRIIGEARTPERIDQLIDKFSKLANEMLQENPEETKE